MFYWSICKSEFCQEAGLLDLDDQFVEIGIPMADPWTGTKLPTFTIKRSTEIHVDGNIYTFQTRPHGNPSNGVDFQTDKPTGDSSRMIRCPKVLRLVRPLHRIRIVELDFRGSVVQLVPGIFWGENRRGGGGVVFDVWGVVMS